MNEINFNIWAIIIILGGVQGFFLGTYLLARKENRKANKWLAFLLVVIALHLFEYAFDITGLSLRYPVLLAITYPLLFCMGPLYYLYASSLLDGAYKTNAKSILHFLPAVIVLLLMLPFYTMPEAEKINFIKNLAKDKTLTIPTEQLVFMGAHVIQTAVYIFVSYKKIRRKEMAVKEYSADVTLVKQIAWLKKFSFCFFLFFILYFTVILLLTFINSYQVESDYLVMLVIAVSVYMVGYSALSNPEIFRTAQAFTKLDPDPDAREITRISQRYPDLKDQLRACMDLHKPYLKTELKISELADLLGIPAYQLSQLINDEFLVNFYDFINQYRVDAAKKLLIEDKRNFKILSIAYEVGFNSKATFNRVFKKFTDFTPTEYKDRFSSENDRLRS